jgi:hypothetical protein
LSIITVISLARGLKTKPTWKNRDSLNKLKTAPEPEPESHPPEQGGRGLLSQRRTNWLSSVNVIVIL